MTIDNFIQHPGYNQSPVTYAMNNVPNFIIELYDADNVFASLFIEGNLFNASYQTDFNNRIEIDFSDIYAQYLATAIPDSQEASQNNYAIICEASFTNANGDTVSGFTWRVANAQLKSETPFESWASNHFLTNQPEEKRTNADAQEWLTYLTTGSTWLKARFYRKAGGYTDANIRYNNIAGCFSVDVSYSRVIAMASEMPALLLGYYDILITSGNEVVCRQRYVYEQRSGREKHFQFVNALGGIDTLVCQGENVLQPEVTHNIGRFGKSYTAIDDTEDRRIWQQNTGMVPHKQRNWLHELLSSKRPAYLYDPATSSRTPIVVTESDIAISDAGQLASATFAYMLADTANIIADTERDTNLHQSVADQADPFDDISEHLILEMTPVAGGTGSASEAVAIPASKALVQAVMEGESSGDSVYYTINGKESGQFKPESGTFVVFHTDEGDLMFTTENPAVTSILVVYYPTTP